jgi:CheY-like chemotaxis protein
MRVSNDKESQPPAGTDAHPVRENGDRADGHVDGHADGHADGRGEGGRRILLVEDHPDTNRVMTLLLERRGYVVVPTSTVHGALEIAGREQFDLLISDIGLPDGTGLELMQALQAIAPMRGIALSGYGMDDDIRRSREAGFAEHITKPVSTSRLLAVIERLVNA